MSSIDDYEENEAGGFADTSVLSKIFEDKYIEDEMFDTTDKYDDWNGYYKLSISSIDPEKVVDSRKREFKGNKWYPSDFFKKLYVKNFISKATKLLTELQEMELSDVSRKQSIRADIRKMRTYINQANKKYAVDQIACLELISKAMLSGRKVLETLRYLDKQGDLD